MSSGIQEVFSDKSARPHPRFRLGSFLILGVLLASPGSLLVAWNLHLDADFPSIGLQFLELNAGYLCGALLAHRVAARIPVRRLAGLGAGVAAIALAGLALSPRPGTESWQSAGLVALGGAAGILSVAVLNGLGPWFVSSARASFERACLLFGCGCVLSVLLVQVAYRSGHAPLATGFLAPVVCLAPFILPPHAHVPLGASVSRPPDFLRRNAAVLLTTFVFLQSGSEWALAAWLPVFLLRQFGITPMAALTALGLYFAFLLIGRLLGAQMVHLVRRRALLPWTTLLTVAGFVTLAFSQALPGAFTAIVLIGLGFGPVYPSLARTLDARFSYEVSFYNRLLCAAVTGALVTAWLLGYVNEYGGIRYLIVLPAVGSVVSCALLVLLMLESHMTGCVEA